MRTLRYRRPLSAAVIFTLLAAVLVLTEGWYWGSDSNSSPGSQFGTRVQVYVGELGHGNVSTCNTQTFFNVTDAIAVDNNNGSLDNVFSYWFLQGPSLTGVTGNTAYALGENEAIDLYNCWLTAPKAGYSGGLTLFADAETGTGYWYSPPFNCDCESTARWQDNVNVISGFVVEASSLMGSHETAGVYGGLSTFFNSKTPGQVWPNDYFIWDAAGGCSGYITHPAILQSTTYYETAEVDWHSYNEAGDCLAGGQGFSMWQYYTTGVDYELTPQQGNVGCFTGNVHRCGGYFVYGYGRGTK